MTRYGEELGHNRQPYFPFGIIADSLGSSSQHQVDPYKYQTTTPNEFKYNIK
jgi:hypothetical protein